MLEIRLVEGTRRENHDQRIGAVVIQAAQAFAHFAEERAHPPHSQIADGLRQHLLDDVAILERIACPRWCLRAVREQPPAPIRCARDVGGVDMQPARAARHESMTGPQKIGVTEGQLRRDQTFGEQALRTVEVAEQGIEQSRALHDTLLNPAPLVLGDDQRQRIQCPRPIGALRIGVDVVGNAVLDDQAARELERAARGIVRLVSRQPLNERSPVRPHGAPAIEKLVIAARIGSIGRKTGLRCGAWRQRMPFAHQLALHVRRRSSV